MQAMQMNRPHFPEYTLPILCMHGTKDVTTSLAAAEAFVQVRALSDCWPLGLGLRLRLRLGLGLEEG